MKTKFKSVIHATCNSFGGAVCAAAILLTASSVEAQNLFVVSGGTITEITPGGAQTTFASGFSSLSGLAFDRAGDLFVVDNGSGNIYEFTNGVAADQGIFASIYSPVGMAFNSAGGLCVASGNIYDYTNAVAADQGIFASGVGNAYQLAFNSAGDLFVTSQGNFSVLEITPGGVRSSLLASYSGYPAAVAVDSAGDLFVGLNTINSIYEFVNTNGTLNTTPISIATGLDSPAGLAFDSAGDLFEADRGSGNIYEFTNNAGTLSSSAVTFASGFDGPAALAFAPNPTLSVSIKMFAGVILNNGQIGSNYLIQATSNLSTSNWITLTNATLPTNPYIYIDYGSLTNGQQFYRVLPQ